MASSITEREVAADLKEELNQYIQQGGTPFSAATVENRAGTATLISPSGLSFLSKLLLSGN